MYGTRASVEVDLDGRLLRWSRPSGAPGPFGKLEMPLRHFAEAGKSLGRNFWRLLRGGPPVFCRHESAVPGVLPGDPDGARECPTPPDEVRRVTVIMDDISEACRRAEREPGRAASGRGA